MKPISASDQRTLDQAIAMANELATRSMLELDGKGSCDAVDHSVAGHMATMTLDSPRTPSSPSKRKFSFKFGTKTSPKHERRNFTQEAASIAGLQVNSLTLLCTCTATNGCRSFAKFILC